MTAHLLLFAATELLLSATPGPAVLLVVSQGIRRGYRSSTRAAAGILTGNAIYFALSAAGLGALLMASKRVFDVLQIAGAAYLVLIGSRMLLQPARVEPAAIEDSGRAGSGSADGVCTGAAAAVVVRWGAAGAVTGAAAAAPIG